LITAKVRKQLAIVALVGAEISKSSLKTVITPTKLGKQAAGKAGGIAPRVRVKVGNRLRKAWQNFCTAPPAAVAWYLNRPACAVVPLYQPANLLVGLVVTYCHFLCTRLPNDD
jgi:hypothetical protein